MCDHPKYPIGKYNIAATTRSVIDVTPEILSSVAEEVIEKVIQKNHDYADVWQKQGMPGIACRLADKLYRVETLLGKEVLVVDESIEDTLIDLIGYGLLGLLYLRARNGQDTN